MELSPRDDQTVRFVATFKQVSAAHLAQTIFADVSSTPLDRSLQRLVGRKFLARAGRRATGIRGGAGAYVYQLGPRGWHHVHREGRYWAYRAVSDHQLKVADVFVDLIAAERSNQIKMLRCEVEQPIGETRADLAVELGFPATQERAAYFLEIDLGSERAKRLEHKLQMYWRAYMASEVEHFPYIVFLVPDAWRKSDVEFIIGKMHEGRELFHVAEFSEMLDVIASI